MSFQKVKEAISSLKGLAHYNLDVLLQMYTKGIGAVLSHTLPRNSIQPVAYASHSLSSAKDNHSLVGKEAVTYFWRD